MVADGDGGGGVCVTDRPGRRHSGEGDGHGYQERDPVGGEVGHLVPGDSVGRPDQHDGRGYQGNADGPAELTYRVEHR